MTSAPDHSLDDALARLETAVDELIARRAAPRRRRAFGPGQAAPAAERDLSIAVAANPDLTLTCSPRCRWTRPSAASALERRFLDPFVARHFGEDFPRLDIHGGADSRNALPPNIRVEEFYLQSGAMLGSSRRSSTTRASTTRMWRARVAERGINVLVQKVAREPGGTRLSLSCNPDITFDLLDAHRRARAAPAADGRRSGSATCPTSAERLRSTPNSSTWCWTCPVRRRSCSPCRAGRSATPISPSACTPARWSRTAARCRSASAPWPNRSRHALVLRHTRHAALPAAARQRCSPGFAASALVREDRRHRTIQQGLYGASEMVNDGFMRLAQAGILKRRRRRRYRRDAAHLCRASRPPPSTGTSWNAKATGWTAASTWARASSTIGCATCRQPTGPRHGHDPHLADQRALRQQRGPRAAAAPGRALLQHLHDDDRARRRRVRRAGRRPRGFRRRRPVQLRRDGACPARRTLDPVVPRRARGRRQVELQRALELRAHAPFRAICATSPSPNTAVADLRGASDGECTEGHARHCATCASSRPRKARRAPSESWPPDFQAAASLVRQHARSDWHATLLPFRRMGCCPSIRSAAISRRWNSASCARSDGFAPRPARQPASCARSLPRSSMAAATTTAAMQRMRLAKPNGFGERLEARLVGLALDEETRPVARLLCGRIAARRAS